MLAIDKLPRIYFDCLSELPDCPAVYYVLDENLNPLYIGKAVNLNARWLRHHRELDLRAKDAYWIAWEIMGRDKIEQVEAARLLAEGSTYDLPI